MGPLSPKRIPPPITLAFGEVNWTVTLSVPPGVASA
jgi:hypothetical protein